MHRCGGWSRYHRPVRRHRVPALLVLALLTSLTVAAGSPSPAFAAAGDPIGAIDTVGRGSGTVVLSGWAGDRDAGGPIAVHVYVDGRLAGAGNADLPRSDVATRTGLGAGTGFRIEVPAGASGEACAFAIDVGPGSNVRIGCRRFGSSTPSAVPSGLPFGLLDLVEGGPGGTATLSGWALDPDSSGSIDVHVYADGVVAGVGTANLNRPDVGAAFGKGDLHGFRLSVPVPAGARQVCVFGIDAGGAGPNPSVACRTFGGAAAPSSSAGNRVPIGSLDGATPTVGTLTLDGWALDPDTTGSIDVHVYVDNRFAAAAPANQSRADVGAVFGLGDLHGFHLDVAVANGAHQVCVFGIDAGGGPNPAVACRNVFVGPATGGGPGAVLTPTGHLVSVIANLPGGGWRIHTPCFNEATITQGTFIPTVDFVIDPGHGGSESGSVGSNGLVEKRLNLEIANRLATILRAQGYTVALTRTTDVRIPLVSRAVLADSLRPRAFLSIHHNGGSPGGRSAPAPEAYYKHDSPEARRLAGILYEELRGAFAQYSINWTGTSRGVTSRLREDGDDLYGIHRYSGDVPSVITEPAYLSSPSEAALLARSDVQQTEAQALAAGLNRWVNTSDVGSGFTPHFTDPNSTGTGGTEGCVDPPLQ